MGAELIVIEPRIKAQRFQLDKSEFIIGREEPCDLIIDEQKVSKQHAKIIHEKGVYFIQDLNSTNGTFVNQRKVTKVKLLNKATIRIGSYEMSFSEGDAETLMLDSPFKGESVAEGDATLIESAPPEFQFDQRNTVPSYMPDLIQKRDFARLYLVNEENKGMDFLLDHEEMFIGTDDENDITLKLSFVSRKHAKLLRIGEDYTLIDLNSTNGVFVNNKKIKEKKLASGDLIGIGAARMRFSDRGEIFSPFLEQKKSAGVKIPVLRIVLILLIMAVAGGAFFMYSQHQEKQIAQQRKQQKTTNQYDADFAKGEESYNEQKWEEAIESYEKIGKGFKEEEKRIQQIAKAKQEMQNRKDFYRLMDALEKKDFAGATTQASTIPPDSWYHTEAMRRLADSRTEYLDSLLQLGQQQTGENLFEEAINTYQTALKLDPGNEQFTGLLANAEQGKANHDATMQQAGQKAQAAERYRGQVARAQRSYTDSSNLYQQGKIAEALAALDGIAKLGLASKEKILGQATARKALIQEIDGYYKAGQGLNSQNNQPDAITKWEEMLKQEKKLGLKGRSAYAQEVSAVMAGYYARNGDEKYNENKFPLAYELWKRALDFDSTNQKAKNGLDKLNTKAQDLYREGYSAAGYNNIDRAKKLFREVLTIVPPDNEYYKKSQEKLIQYE